MKTSLSVFLMLISFFAFAQPKLTRIEMDGLSSQQRLLINELEQKKQSNLDSLYRRKLTIANYVNKRSELEKSTSQSLGTILSPGQYNSHKDKISTFINNKSEIQNILVKFREELFNMKNLPANDRRNYHFVIRSKAISDLSEFMSVDNATTEIDRIEITRYVLNGEIPVTNLSWDQAFDLGKLKLQLALETDEIEQQQLTHKELLYRSIEAKARHQEQVKNLIGNEKYRQWRMYRDGLHQREYKSYYEFTNEQYEHFKNIENTLAIEIHKIKKSKLSLNEKTLKIEEAKKMKVDKLKDLLSPEQFEKWYKDYSAREIRRIR